jgi:hypothetical protein
MIRNKLLAICLCFLAGPAVSLACTCSNAAPGACAGLQQSDTVFLGTVTDVAFVRPTPPPEGASSPTDTNAAAPAPDANGAAAATSPAPDASGTAATPAPTPTPTMPVIRYHFKIDERYAGPYSTEMDIFSGGDDGDCGYRFEKGTQYIVFTQQEADGQLFATICNGTRPAIDGRALRPQLRAMRDGRNVASVFGELRRADPPFLGPPDPPVETPPDTPPDVPSDAPPTAPGDPPAYTKADVPDVAPTATPAPAPADTSAVAPEVATSAAPDDSPTASRSAKLKPVRANASEPVDPPMEPANADDSLPHVALKLQSSDDRFQTSTDANGVYSFYDMNSGTYSFTAKLPARMQLSLRTLPGELPPFTIPNGACYEYDVEALSTGHIQGSVLGPGGKPLKIASVELYRVGHYDDERPGLWSFQGAKGVFDFDHIGPGQYVLVFNRTNKQDPNSPFPRAFYPGVTDIGDAKPITLKDGQDLSKVNMKLSDGYPTREMRVLVKWTGARPAGSVTVMAKAGKGDNPSAEKIGEGVYQFTLLASDSYTISAWEDLLPQHVAPRRKAPACTIPARIDTATVSVDGADGDTKDVTLIFPETGCGK